MAHLFEECPNPESLRARSRAMQQLFEEAQIDAETWEENVTGKPNAAVTTVLEKVIHEFVTDLKSRNCSLLGKFR